LVIKIFRQLVVKEVPSINNTLTASDKNNSGIKKR